MANAKLTAKEKQARERHSAEAKAAEKFALWAGEARKLGSACRGSFVRVIKAAMRDGKAQAAFGDDRAALDVFEAALSRGEILRRTLSGIGGEVEVYEMKK